jgi:SAM-dependent methyltransferase
MKVVRQLRPAGVDAALARASEILNRARASPGPDADAHPALGPDVGKAPVDALPAQIRDPKTTAAFAYTPEALAAITQGLKTQGFEVSDLTVDPAAYRAYFEAAEYAQRYPHYYSFNLPEKSLEHFVAAQLLGLSSGDIYIDIASEHSPVPEIYSRLFGCVSYRQDLAYRAGLNGSEIGGDAAAMPVPDGFATAMALHCSFEHFEGDADERFIREIGRVLRPGGRVCFAPLYLWHEYGVLTDPAVAVAEGVEFNRNAVVYCKPGWGNRHGRLYDPANLHSRIRRNLDGMQMTLYRIVNATDVHESCYLQFALTISRP